ncbi:MAG: alpha/beta hydrolase [Gemmatimonadales bacterium]
MTPITRRPARFLPPLQVLLLLSAPLRAQAPASPAVPADAIPRHETFRIDSRVLAEQRTINVYTPPGYDHAPHGRFPVVYMPDGGMAEDFPHVANTLDSLIALRAVPPLILVGIENAERRRDLTGPTRVAQDSTIAPRVGGSAAFRGFIREELIPWVRGRYRTTGETAIVGESLAGLFIVETFLLEPGLFRRYIALSPSVWWNDGALVASAARHLRRLDGKRRVLFLSAADEPGIADGTAALADTIRTLAPPGLLLLYEPRPDLEHSTIFRAVAPEAFVRVLGNWTAPGSEPEAPARPGR